MNFSDLLPSDAEREQLEKVCAQFEEFVQECIGSLKFAFEIAQQEGEKDNSPHHITVALLLRHVIESIDGVAVLVSRGCSQPCQPLLRSALEAMLALFYILESDSVRRALAYQITHAHKKLKLYERLDPATAAGQELRKVLAPDPIGGHLLDSLPQQNFTALIANIKKMFAKPEYAPIEAEWQRLKAARSKDPEWYSLFGGPSNVRDLAIKVGFPGMYEFLYRYWSTEVHAGSAFEAVGRKDGVTVIRPIRHPDELQSAVMFASQFTLFLADRVVRAYAPHRREELGQRYAKNIRDSFLELAQKKVITAPWKD